MDKEIRVGNFVNIHCFDGSTITMQVTEVRDNIVYGVSQLGNHWANLKDVEKVITQEDKELLLKDLCARLLYGVKVNYYGTILMLDRGLPSDDELENGVKPYLRPMSSMTEEEEKEFQEIKLSYHFDEDGYILFDWLNKKMFDYRGLIPKGYALEAPENMYNIKTD